MRTRSDKKPNRKYDKKVLVAEESTKSWADSDSDSSSSSSSSSDSEQEEVHCLMADQTSDDELHNHANPTARRILRSYTSTQALTTKNRAQTTRNAHPKAQKKQLLNLLNETSNSRTSRAYGISQLVAPSFQTSINGKSKSQGVQRHQERQKQRLDAMEIGDGKSR
ncbi:hypothetical protein F511_21234 [Dorcoceras hygrometricum]|uniref:Uncharacterized protein n=1 Tax=Dorcoceras hygrometricum TaxID=472368 RepID=A0A2Z7BM47_9LAMI|nr:hypothetical protein F511_21234 [Dorcoceras hygrometricum]